MSSPRPARLGPLNAWRVAPAVPRAIGATPRVVGDRPDSDLALWRPMRLTSSLGHSVALDWGGLVRAEPVPGGASWRWGDELAWPSYDDDVEGDGEPAEPSVTARAAAGVRRAVAAVRGPAVGRARTSAARPLPEGGARPVATWPARAIRTLTARVSPARGNAARVLPGTGVSPTSTRPPVLQPGMPLAGPGAAPSGTVPSATSDSSSATRLAAAGPLPVGEEAVGAEAVGDGPRPAVETETGPLLGATIEPGPALGAAAPPDGAVPAPGDTAAGSLPFALTEPDVPEHSGDSGPHAPAPARGGDVTRSDAASPSPRVVADEPVRRDGGVGPDRVGGDSAGPRAVAGALPGEPVPDVMPLLGGHAPLDAARRDEGVGPDRVGGDPARPRAVAGALPGEPVPDVTPLLGSHAPLDVPRREEGVRPDLAGSGGAPREAVPRADRAPHVAATRELGWSREDPAAARTFDGTPLVPTRPEGERRRVADQPAAPAPVALPRDARDENAERPLGARPIEPVVSAEPERVTGAREATHAERPLGARPIEPVVSAERVTGAREATHAERPLGARPIEPVVAAERDRAREATQAEGPLGARPIEPVVSAEPERAGDSRDAAHAEGPLGARPIEPVVSAQPARASDARDTTNAEPPLGARPIGRAFAEPEPEALRDTANAAQPLAGRPLRARPIEPVVSAEPEHVTGARDATHAERPRGARPIEQVGSAKPERDRAREATHAERPLGARPIEPVFAPRQAGAQAAPRASGRERGAAGPPPLGFDEPYGPHGRVEPDRTVAPAAPDARRPATHTAASAPDVAARAGHAEGPLPTPARVVRSHRPGGSPLDQRDARATELAASDSALPLRRLAATSSPPAVPAAPPYVPGADPLSGTATEARTARRGLLGNVPLVLLAVSPTARPDAATAAAVTRITGVPVADATVRRGPAVESAARALGTAAFTYDGVVHLPDRHGPLGTPAARDLLAHELTHVAQHRRATLDPAHRPALPPAGVLEAEARDVARLVGRPTAGTGRPEPPPRADTTGVWGETVAPPPDTPAPAQAFPEPAQDRAPAPEISQGSYDHDAALDRQARLLYPRVRALLDADLARDRQRAGRHPAGR